MAKKPHSSIPYQMTRGERIAGWCWLPFYLMLLSYLLNLCFRLAGIPVDAIILNILYFVINLIFVLIAFRRFLQQRFFGTGFWDFVQALILGAVLYYACSRLILIVVTKLYGEFTVFNDSVVESLAAQNRTVMLVVSVILAPIIEESLIRGVVFGSFYGTSRFLAYFVSTFVFVFMHNWTFFATQPLVEVLLSCLPYIPAAVALGWVYHKSGSIWCSITLHALINAVSFGILILP